MRCVHYERETQQRECILSEILFVVWHFERWVANTQREIEGVREEAEKIDPVHETGEVLAALNLQLLNLEPHEKYRSKHAHTVADEHDWLDEYVHLDKEWNEKAYGVTNKHKPVDLLRVLVLEVNDVTDHFLLIDVTIGLFDNVQDHVREVVVRHSKIGQFAWVVAHVHDFAIMVRVFFDVLYFLLENVKAHVEEQTLDSVVLATGQWTLFLQQVLVDSMMCILPELVIIVQVRESL